VSRRVPCVTSLVDRVAELADLERF